MQVTKQILEGSAENDRRSQKQLYEYCYRQFIRLCLRYHTNHEDARHALNNGFLKIVNGLQNVDLNELNFPAWSKRIIVNTLIDEYRKNKNHNQAIVAKETERELIFAAEKVENDGAMELSYQEVLDLLKTIPPISAHVFTLYVIDGYSHKEIGDLLEITEGTSKWHLSTARKLLRERLELMENRHEKRFVI
ncbi:RNA polymerase sigma factor [Fluviicola sp.]|jgi:RNA polymerase sigma-70 factor (ECF subfamily)|uniref:RNA polymerase sigma factor n=1 Tax=Fluviicola sp. TaxID=1917219 RepID=UPI00282A26E2|nr:RNA polymerase sigma factor [Fluviicola sp.]MDR0801316.1 RNA polymerase sigma factor [Fluviicola sp.]